MTCTRCGKRYLGNAAHGRRARYRYYTRIRYGTDRCPSDRLRADHLEQQVIDALLTKALAAKTVERVGLGAGDPGPGGRGKAGPVGKTKASMFEASMFAASRHRPPLFAQSPRNVEELAAAADLGMSTCSAHLGALREADLVATRARAGGSATHWRG
jgi:DNA-binding transcriptional ArsR family regulator